MEKVIQEIVFSDRENQYNRLIGKNPAPTKLDVGVLPNKTITMTPKVIFIQSKKI